MSTELEEFEKWAASEGRSIKRSNPDYAPRPYVSAATNNALDGWQARQPEIDTLSVKLESMIKVKNKLATKCNQQDAEIDALKAENERLRKDAERYRWLREHVVEVDFWGDEFILDRQQLDEHIDSQMADKGE